MLVQSLLGRLMNISSARQPSSQELHITHYMSRAHFSKAVAYTAIYMCLATVIVPRCNMHSAKGPGITSDRCR